MKWEYLFDDDILSRGRRYYRDGCVGTVQKTGDDYSGVVHGSSSYRVSAHFHVNGSLESVSCTCPYAHRGLFCKHMAALLFAIDAGHVEEVNTGTSDGSSIWKNSKILESELVKMEERFSDRYYYFDFPSMIRKLHILQTVWNKGKALAANGTIRWKDFRILKNYESILAKGETQAIAVGEIVREHNPVDVEITIGRNEILQMTCGNWSCPETYYSFTAKDRVCEHEAALLYLLGEYIHEHNPGDATDDSGAQLLRGIENLRTGPEESDLHRELTGGTRQNPLVLEPFFRGEPSGDAPLIGFSIGDRKLYKIKDLSAFSRAMTHSEPTVFGKGTTLFLGEERLSKESRPLWKLIRSAAEELWEARRLGVSGNISTMLGETIPLYGERLDAFFALMNQKRVEMRVAQGVKRDILFRDHSLPVDIHINDNTDDNGIFHGLTVSGTVPTIYRGLDHAYYFDDRYLNRVNGEDILTMEPLLEIARGGEISFRIGRKNLSSFMYDTLPWLEKHTNVTFPNRENAEKHVPPKAAFAFYLDADGRSAVCTAMVHYGANAYPLTDLFREPAENPAGNPDSIRDLDREKNMLHLLRQYFPEMTDDSTRFSTGKKEEFVYLLLEEGVERLIAAGEVSSTDDFRRLAIRRKTTFTVGVSLQSNLLTMHVQGDELSSDELIEVLSHYDRKKKFYRLKSGDFVNLDQENIAELEKMMESLHLSPKEFVDGKMNIPAYRTLYLDRMLENVEGLYADRDRRFKTLVKEFKTISDADFEVPLAMKGVLRKYQKTGYRWMRTLAQYGFGGILADEMGLGKTLQTIALIEARREERERNPAADAAPVTALIVTPASLVYNWGEELARFAPKLRVNLITGTQSERAERIRDAKDFDVLVTSYDLLKRDAAEYEDLEFDFEIIDEAQYIKNHTTAAAKAVKLIRSRSRFALTGTPIENRLSELWSIFDYLMPGFLFRYEDFRHQIELPVVKEEDAAVSEHLSRMVAPFILRRFKKDVLTDLPEKLEEVRYSVMSGEQKKLYDAQMAHMRSILRSSDSKEEFNKNRMQILAELLRLREICCDPAMYLENYHGGSVKREACMDLIRSAIDGEHRILVFSQFTSMMRLLEESLQEEKIAYYKLDGRTPSEERLRLVNQFNAGDVPVFLISLGAGGTGLNLTGADVVIHYDPWWNLAREDQATGRAHRIGQKRKVSVYKMIVKGSIEEKILDMQNLKKKLAEDILGAEAVGSGSITREDLMELLM